MEHVEVTVWNSGHPIPQERLGEVFDAFKKGDTNATGLGLGLFIVREIAQAHLGSVAVTSDAGGTVFTFRLPRNNSTALAADTSATANHTTIPAPSPTL